MAKEKAFFRRKGDKLDYKCTADVAEGDVIVVGSICGVAESAGITGQLIALTVGGVFSFETDAAAIDQGARVYLKDDGTVTATQGSNTYLGIAWSPAVAGAGATVDVKINAGADVAAAAAASEGTE